MGGSMVTGKLNRLYLQAKATIGMLTLYNDSKQIYTCYTLEDEVRGDGDPATVAEWKVKGKSAIPYGTYKVRKTWSKKFGRDAWELLNVAGFAGIRIHAGNTADDTEGCILLGEDIDLKNNRIVNSKFAIDKFERILEKEKVQEWELEIIREVKSESN